MITFMWFWILILIPLPLLMIYLVKQKNIETGSALFLPNAQKTSNNLSIFKNRRIVAWLIWIFVVLAASRPTILGDLVEIPTSGRDIILTVDLSGSMSKSDMSVRGRPSNRLESVKYIAGNFIKRRVGDRFGLVLFSDNAYLQAPLTLDRNTVANYLDESSIGMIGENTAIGAAIGVGLKHFIDIEKQVSDTPTDRVIILLTDGINNRSMDPIQAANLASTLKVKIYTIGIGGDNRYNLGGITINGRSELDEASLKNIANLTGGKYFRARDESDLEKIYTEVDKLEPVQRDVKSYRLVKELFYYPLLIAFLISISSLLIPFVMQFIKRKEKFGARL